MSSPSGTTTYAYNSINQLIGVTTPTDTWTYQYDALGNVIATTHNGQTTQDLVDPTGSGSLTTPPMRRGQGRRSPPNSTRSPLVGTTTWSARPLLRC